MLMLTNLLPCQVRQQSVEVDALDKYAESKFTPFSSSMKNYFIGFFMIALANAWRNPFQDLFPDYPKHAKKMPQTERQLILLKEDCGEVCDTSDKWFKQPGKYFDMIKKEFECDFLFESDLEVPRIDSEQFEEFKAPMRAFTIPPEILELYTYDQRVPVHSNHMDDAKWTENEKENIWSQEFLEIYKKQFKDGEFFFNFF